MKFMNININICHDHKVQQFQLSHVTLLKYSILCFMSMKLEYALFIR